MAKSGVAAQQEISRVIANQRRIIQQIESKAEKFLDAAGRLGVNASKDKNRPDTWTDRTGNLRSSITHYLENIGEVGSKTASTKQAVVFAGMEYAPFVHFREGYRVLVPPPPDEVERIKHKLGFPA